MSKRFVFQHVGFATVRKGLLDVFSMNLKLEIPCVPRSASIEPVPERFSLMKCSVDRALPIEQLLAATGTKLYSGLFKSFLNCLTSQIGMTMTAKDAYIYAIDFWEIFVSPCPATENFEYCWSKNVNNPPYPTLAQQLPVHFLAENKPHPIPCL